MNILFSCQNPGNPGVLLNIRILMDSMKLSSHIECLISHYYVVIY